MVGGDDMDNNRIKKGVDERIRHLTDVEIQTLINRYYSGENVKALIKEYKIDINSSRLYTVFPPKISNNVVCPNCNLSMFIAWDSKSSYNFNKNNEYCSKCGHRNSIFCNCDYCNEKKQLYILELEEEERKRIQRKRKLIQEEYDISQHEPINVEDLSFMQKVYLGAILRLALSEDISIIRSLDSIQGKLAPTKNFSNEIVKELINNRIVVVSPDSPIDAFVESPEDNEFPRVYYMYKVNYVLNLYMNTNHYEVIANLINPGEISEEDKPEALSLWKTIALEECLEYLYYQMNKVKFDFNAGDKTITVLEDLLEHFSVSQIYGIIYKSIANATKYYQESNISKKQAANSVVGNCQRYGERAIVGKWDLSKYRKVVDCPQSMISEFFFNRILGIGDLGFHMPPVSL